MFNLFKKNNTEILSPAEGEIITLEQVQDPVFSSKLLGDGFAIKLKDGRIFSPINGKVVSIFPTKHALGLIDENGLEVLIHIGIDTVSLNGKGFAIFVTEGEKITTKTQLAQVDLNFLKLKSKDSVTIIIFPTLKGVLPDIETGSKKINDIVCKIST
ncbi:PTS glucose transporter subunit IIA [Enterococcus avium]|uniref:PTS sugar transporter subunit IIA n=1 Tax=Enterococcus avium TaxID=33945 RepID=UPI003D6B8AFE